MSEPQLMSMDWAYSPEAEQSLLGGLLIDNGAFDNVGDLIVAEDFYLDAHRRMFRAISAMVQSGRLADVVTVGEHLQRDHAQAFEAGGGFAYLASLAQNVPSALNVRRYAELVQERSICRRLFAVANDISVGARNRGSRSARELLDDAEERILAVGDAGAAAGDFRDLQQVLSEVFEYVDRKFHEEGNSPVTGVPTGFENLDIQTTGLQGGDLVVVAARPGMGKSAFSLNVAENAARAAGKPAAIFGLEMSNRQTGLRLLAAEAGINLQRLVTGNVSEAEWSRLSTAVGKLHEVPMLFNEDAGLTVGEMRTLARRAFRKYGGLSVIVLDYLQLMLSGDSDANRANELAGITRGLKLLAKELDVPIIALSQLSRECEKRGNKRPLLSDLRDSGAIEQDADIVLFIYRDEYYNPRTEDQGVAEIIVAKQRNGPVGTVRLHFRADMTRFENERTFPEARAA